MLFVICNGVYDSLLVFDGDNLLLDFIFINGMYLFDNEYMVIDSVLSVVIEFDEFVLEIINIIVFEYNKVLEGLYLLGGVYCM